MPDTALKLRHLIEAGGAAIKGPFEGKESMILMADLDAGATGTMPSALLPDLIKPVLAHHRAGRRDEAAAYARILPLINYENRQCGLRATKTVMMEGGVIKSDAVRHPLEPLDAGSRAGLLELAREVKPLALRWGEVRGYAGRRLWLATASAVPETRAGAPRVGHAVSRLRLDQHCRRLCSRSRSPSSRVLSNRRCGARFRGSRRPPGSQREWPAARYERRRDYAGSGRRRFAPSRGAQDCGRQFSSDVVAPPERRDISVTCDTRTSSSLDRCRFLISERIETGAARLDFARDRREFLLVLGRPRVNSFEYVFGRLVHGSNIAH
jgi:hypothetical protein